MVKLASKNPTRSATFAQKGKSLDITEVSKYTSYLKQCDKYFHSIYQTYPDSFNKFARNPSFKILRRFLAHSENIPSCLTIGQIECNSKFIEHQKSILNQIIHSKNLKQSENLELYSQSQIEELSDSFSNLIQSLSSSCNSSKLIIKSMLHSLLH